jgi:ribosomal protein S18 acetylase RimI-like enzyme
MALTDQQADQIAALLNERNELTVPYSRAKIRTNADNYICHFSDEGAVIACVEVKKVQWYQAEILHLTVAKQYARLGHAKRLLQEAEQAARAHNARILQCTIRESNGPSRALFETCGFRLVSEFFNAHSGNNIGVFQKSLASRV